MFRGTLTEPFQSPKLGLETSLSNAPPKAVRGAGEDVPVPHVEELGPELHADTFGNLGSLYMVKS
jgi:hypothetical protein